jgi:hypothetical protein
VTRQRLNQRKAFYEGLCIVLDAGAVRNDQLIEIASKQLSKGLSPKFSVNILDVVGNQHGCFSNMG